MRTVLVDSGLATCLRSPQTVDTAQCDALTRTFRDDFDPLQVFAILLLILPLLVGLFIGAPLVAREVEQGNHRLLWTQGVTRRRWTATKVGLVLAATAVLSGMYALLAYWWLTPLAEVHDGRFRSGLFDMQGLVPVGYTLFAVSLGICAGTIWRRTLPAMAVTLAGYLGARVAVGLARPYLLPVAERRFPILGSGRAPADNIGDWVISSGLFDASGKHLADGFMLCSTEPTGTELDRACLGFGPGDYNLEVIHPASQLWTYQLLETGIFAALAGALLLVAFHRIRRIT
jgi:ABC-type transport system involved in multi-copper enzyme maturation permease subunit